MKFRAVEHNSKLPIKSKAPIELKWVIGNRVECVKTFSTVQKGTTGIINKLNSRYLGTHYADHISITWDTYVNGHTCGNRCEDGYGLCVPREYLELV
jgi:hypothetical protein